jgi:hypothetical protein
MASSFVGMVVSLRVAASIGDDSRDVGSLDRKPLQSTCLWLTNLGRVDCMLSRSAKSAPAVILLVALLSAGLTGCAVPGFGGISGLGDSSAPTTKTVTLADPVDNAFTVDVPEGWDSVAYSTGRFEVHRNVVSTVSPDGKTVMFVGDPKLPYYWEPDFVTDIFRKTVTVVDFYEIKKYQKADKYMPKYVTAKFGELPEFEILSVGPEPDLLSAIEKTLNGGFEASTAEVRFSYSASGETINAVVVGWALNGGTAWSTDVYGLATNRDTADYRPMLNAMASSVTATEDYTQRAQANHEQSMAQIQAFGEELTRQHNANMAWIQQSAAAHQQRMQAIWAQGDASMQSYYDRMDSMDHTQRDFLNYINEEETVSGGETGTRQVASGATRYWVNKNDGTYVGGDINFGDAQLRALGLNPNDYEQVTIVK